MRRLAVRADVNDIDGWFRRILKQLTTLLAAAWRAIRELTGMWLEDHAAAEGRTVEPTLAEWNTEQVLINLRVQGPVAFKEAIAGGHEPQHAKAVMASQLSGTASKIVLRGDRDTVMATIENSGEIVGWRRVSDGDPCHWCAMLVSRGAVYETRVSATRVVDRRASQPLGASYHDHCHCTAEPLYEHEDEPPEVQALYAEWRRVTAGKSGAEAMRAWRAHWDNRERPSAPPTEPESPRPNDDRQQRARDRQETIDAARRRAQMLAELEEIAVINEASGDELARMARVAAERFGVVDDPELEALLRRAASGDAAMVEATLEAVAERLGLTRIGGDLGAKQIVKFDKTQHDMLPGQRPTPFVEVARPGFMAVIDGEQKVLIKAVVAESDERPAPAASKFYRSLRGREELAEIARLANGAERRKLYGGQSARVELAILPDGRRAVSKRAEDWGDTSPEAQADLRHAADAEQLADLLAQAIDAPVARVYRDTDDHVWVEYIEGSPDDVSAAMLDGLEGIRLGLLDALSAGSDRNGGNMIGRRAKLLGIDHGASWHLLDPDEPSAGDDDSPLARHFTNGRKWKDNPLTPSDIAILRRRIEALRPDFALLKREEWLEYALNVLERLARHAKGSKSLYHE